MMKVLVTFLFTLALTALLSLFFMPLCVMVTGHRGYAFAVVPVAFVVSLLVVIYVGRGVKKH